MAIFDFILHIDQYLTPIIANYGILSYLVIFLIIFCETGLVFMPFLPGDSLLFITGAFAATGALNITLLTTIILGAAILGDTVNYWIGNFVGPRAFRENASGRKPRFFKKEYLDRTHAFYEKHGGKTIIFARFIPIIRTFAPFVAGIGAMKYRTFILYNILGAVLWVSFFVFGGFLFGNIPAIKDNLTIVIFGIIFVSVLPGIWHAVQRGEK